MSIKPTIPDNHEIEVVKAGKTGLFTNYIFKAIPLAFDESMSYYETLCALLNYLKNTIIPTVNNNADATSELQNLYTELKNYVDTYFDNLDVQEEINNKLDEMTESGELERIIIKYFQNITVSYKQFGAKGDGKTDDFLAILNTHLYANEHGIKVIGEATSNYYIKNITQTIPIKTNVDWNNCKFTIDDSDNTLNNIPLFEVKSNNQIEELDNIISSINKGQTVIPNLSYRGDIIVEAINSNKKDYIRTGSLKNEGSNRTEIFRVDNLGNVLDEIYFDFTNITSLKVRNIDKTKLFIKNANFTTIINQIDSYNYYSRNIVISRDNTIVDNITHTLENENVSTSSPYSGFIYTNFCYNIKINNCTLSGHKFFIDSETNTSKGNYDIQNYKTLYCYINNLNQINSIIDTKLWGLHTSNYSKNLYFDKCNISRIDSHRGVYNISIKNCILGHQSMRLIGAGKCIIENTNVYNSTEFLLLREDYGASWDGDISIINCKYQDKTGRYIRSIIRAINAGNHNYGYKCYGGRNITIENFEYNSLNNNKCAIYNTGNTIPDNIDYSANYEENVSNSVYPLIYPSSLKCKKLFSSINTNYFVLTQQKDIENEYCDNLGYIPLTVNANTIYSLSSKYTFNTYIELDDVIFNDISSETYKNGLCNLWDLRSFQTKPYQNTYRPIFYLKIKNCKNLYLGLSGRGCYVETENCSINLITEGYGGDYCFFNLKKSIINYQYANTSNISSTRVFNVSTNKLIIDNCQYTIQSGLTLDDIREYEIPFNTITVNNNELKFSAIYYNNNFWDGFFKEFRNNSYYSNLINNNNLSPNAIVTNIKRN